MKLNRVNLLRGSRSIAAAAAVLGLAACGGEDAPSNGPSGTAATGDLVTVDISDVYSMAMFEGTPMPAELDNLEAVPAEPLMELQLPAGATENVALGKPVTSSDPFPIIGELELVTDGDTGGGDGSYVELGPDLQWVQIDLEQEHEIHAIHVWHFHKNAVAYIDVVVQISSEEEFQNEDGTSADHVVTVFNSDHDGSSGLGLSAGTDPAYVETNHGRVMMVDGVRGRYVRLYSNGNTNDPLNHYVEVMVYGKPVAGGDAAAAEADAKPEAEAEGEA